MMAYHLMLGIERELDFFKKAIGEFDFNILKKEILKNPKLLELYNGIDLFNPPSAEAILTVSTQIEYISTKTYLIKYTLEEYDKSLEYLHHSAIMIIQHWLNDIVPELKKNLSIPFETKEIEVEALYFKMSDVMDRLYEIYDGLEKNSKRFSVQLFYVFGYSN